MAELKISVTVKRRFWFVPAVYMAWAFCKLSGGRGLEALSGFIARHALKYEVGKGVIG